MPTRPGKRLKTESRLFSVRNVIKSLSRQKVSNLDLQVEALNTQLESLEQLVQRYTTPVNNSYPVITEEDKKELSIAYSKAIAQCEHLMSFRNDKKVKDNTSYKAMVKMAEKTQKFLTSDLRALTSLNAKLGQTLPEALENARTAVVNLDNLNVDIAKGGCMSSRMPLSITTKDGRKIEGMFTKTTNYDLADRTNAVFQKLIDMSSSNIAKDFFRSYLVTQNDVTTDSEKLRRGLGFYHTIVKDPGNWTEAFKFLRNSHILSTRAFSSEEANNIKRYLTDNAPNLEKILNSYSMNTDRLKIKGGSNIDKRNTAMSIVANLFGRSDLLANSASMTIEAGGVKQTGTFMEFVKGASDIAHLKVGDPYFYCNISTGIDGRPVMKDMADLQVIDYICGNVDRHSGNMLYIHDTDSNGNVYLKGIKGIDNDGSFATRDLKEGLGRLSNVKGMKVISEPMANLVSKMSPASLALALKGTNLSDKEIEKAAKRLADIKEGITNGDLQVVKDGDWKNKKLKDFKKIAQDRKMHGWGVFSMVEAQFDKNQRKAELIDVLQNQNPDPGINLKNAEMKNDGKGFELNEAQQIKAKDSIDNVVQELSAGEKGVWFGSDKYTNMLKSAKALQQQLETWRKQSAVTGSPVWDAKKFEKMTNDLREKTETYLERKYSQSASKANRDNSIKRILAANSTMDFTHKFLDKVELSAWDEYRQNNAEYTMDGFARSRQEEKNLEIQQENNQPKVDNTKVINM